VERSFTLSPSLTFRRVDDEFVRMTVAPFVMDAEHRCGDNDSLEPLDAPPGGAVRVVHMMSPSTACAPAVFKA
jgi:hypothetical protein